MSLKQIVNDPFYALKNKIKPEEVTSFVKVLIGELVRKYESIVHDHDALRTIPVIDLLTGKPFSKPYTVPVSLEQELSKRYEELRQLAQTALPLLLQFEHDDQLMGEYLTIDHLFR